MLSLESEIASIKQGFEDEKFILERRAFDVSAILESSP